MHIKTKYHLIVLVKSEHSAFSNASAMGCKIKLTFSLLVIRIAPTFKNIIIYKKESLLFRLTVRSVVCQNL